MLSKFVQSIFEGTVFHFSGSGVFRMTVRTARGAVGVEGMGRG